MRFHLVHGGVNAGRTCWLVAGTFCHGTVQGTYARKYGQCKRCDFFRQVNQEERRLHFAAVNNLLDELNEQEEETSLPGRR